MRNFILKTVIFVTAALTVSGCGKKMKMEDSTRIVRVEKVSKNRQSSMLAYPARIEAALKVNMAFKTGGTLKNVFVSEGDRVRKGMLIAELDSRDYELQLEAVKAEYEGVKADAQRAIVLFADSVATVADYDKARYGLERVKAKYENARNLLDDTKLYAPFDGVVEHRLMDTPAVIGSGMPVLTLLSADMPELVINVPASTRNRINEASAFEATFGFSQTPVALKLINVSPNANANQLYRVRLALSEDVKEKPAVGMSAMVDVIFENDEAEMMTIPSSAVYKRGDSCAVWIFSDGRVQSRNVEIGTLRTDGSVTILSGLKEGERIVTAGVNGLRENQSVKPLAEVSNTNIGGQL